MVMDYYLLKPSSPIQGLISQDINAFGNSALIAETKSLNKSLMYSPERVPPCC